MTGPELRQWRLRMGWTQHEAAAALRTPYRTYQDWEAGVPPGVAEVAAKLLERGPPLS